MPLGATLAAATEGLPEVVLAVVAADFPELRTEAAFLEVASRVEADMVGGGIERHIGWTG